MFKIFWAIFGVSVAVVFLYWFLVGAVIIKGIGLWQSERMSDRISYAIDKNLPLPDKK